MLELEIIVLLVDPLDLARSLQKHLVEPLALALKNLSARLGIVVEFLEFSGIFQLEG